MLQYWQFELHGIDGGAEKGEKCRTFFLKPKIQSAADYRLFHFFGSKQTNPLSCLHSLSLDQFREKFESKVPSN